MILETSTATMIYFSKNIYLITLVSFVNIFTVYCKTDHINKLNCTLIADRMTKIRSEPISVINKCPEGYKNEYISECEDLISREQPFNPDLYRPVINALTNVTYWNKFCAICNKDYETNWYFSLAWDQHASLCENLTRKIQKSEVDELSELTRILINRGMNLTAKFFEDARELECSMEGDWPVHLLYFVTPCIIENFLASQRNRLRSCQYAEKTGRICTNMRLYMEGFSLVLKNNEVIDYDDKLSEFRFSRGEYFVETGYPDVFHVCEEPVTSYWTNHWIKIYILFISIIMVIIGFGMKFYVGCTQQNTTPELVDLYLLSSIPISILLLFIHLSHPVPCVAFHLAQFLWVHHFWWTLLCFCEKFYPAFILYFGGKFEIPVLIIRYLVYFMAGFCLPLASPIIYYFWGLASNKNYQQDIFQMNSSHAEDDQDSCPRIPDHLAVTCVQWLDMLETNFYTLIPALIFIVLAETLLRLIDWYRTKNIWNYDHKDVFVRKMAIIMTIHWILYMIYRKYGGDNSYTILGTSLNTICQFTVDFHYFITIIVCGFKVNCGNDSNGYERRFQPKVIMIKVATNSNQINFQNDGDREFAEN